MRAGLPRNASAGDVEGGVLNDLLKGMYAAGAV